MSRTLLFVVVLVVVAAAPYLITKSNSLVKEASGDGGILTKFIGRGSETSDQDRTDALADHTADESVDPLTGRPLDPLTGAPVQNPGFRRRSYSVADLLRFDATPSWLVQNWSHVTPDLPDSRLHGMRVPIVTGTEAHNLAGSVTYYFDRSQQVERIALHGFCEDPSALLTLVQQRFALRQYAALGPSTYLAYYQNEPISMLRINPTPPSALGAKRFEIDLELNLPRDGATLSDSNQMLLQRMRAADMI